MSEEKQELLTVSEISKKAGVTRNKAWSYIRKNKIKPVKEDKKTYLFDSKIIYKISEKQKKKQSKNNDTVVSNAVSASVLEIIKKQLEIKDKQIEELQKSLQFAQAAAVDSQNKLKEQEKLIEHKNTDVGDLKAENEALKKKLDEMNHRSFWERVFG